MGMLQWHRPKADTPNTENKVKTVFIWYFNVENLQTICKFSFYLSAFYPRPCASHGDPAKSSGFLGNGYTVPSTPTHASSRLPQGFLKIVRNFREWVNTHFAIPQLKNSASLNATHCFTYNFLPLVQLVLTFARPCVCRRLKRQVSRTS